MMWWKTEGSHITLQVNTCQKRTLYYDWDGVKRGQTLSFVETDVPDVLLFEP